MDFGRIDYARLDRVVMVDGGLSVPRLWSATGDSEDGIHVLGSRLWSGLRAGCEKLLWPHVGLRPYSPGDMSRMRKGILPGNSSAHDGVGDDIVGKAEVRRRKKESNPG